MSRSKETTELLNRLNKELHTNITSDQVHLPFNNIGEYPIHQVARWGEPAAFNLITDMMLHNDKGVDLNPVVQFSTIEINGKRDGYDVFFLLTPDSKNNTQNHSQCIDILVEKINEQKNSRPNPTNQPRKHSKISYKDAHQIG